MGIPASAAAGIRGGFSLTLQGLVPMVPNAKSCAESVVVV